VPPHLVSKGIGDMAKRFSATTLIPPGVVLESVDETGTVTVITVRSSAAGVDCPGCGGGSHRVHSRYTRTLADLPLSGSAVQLKLLVRRSRCDRELCARRIFSERLAAAAPWARRTIALLPDREPAPAQAWLSGQPQIEIVTRDRGGAYALAAARALPGAVQIADCWHLMENASQAFLAATRACMRQVRTALGAATVDPALLTAAEKPRYEGYLRREDVNAAVLALDRAGKPIKEIVRCTGHSRGTVRRVLRGQRAEVFRTRESSFEVHLPWLDTRRVAGARNGAALWRGLRDIGFPGSLRVVAEWTPRRRRAEQVNIEGLTRVPSARTVARLMTMARDTLYRTQTVTVAAIEAAVPTLVQAREIVDAFHTLIRRKQEAALDGWLETAAASLLASFARGLARDHHAVRAAISSAWSNAQAEGQINKLKLVKRQMSDRGNLVLLQARVIAAGR
jgi:transposase